MQTMNGPQPINLKVVRFELDFTPVVTQKPKPVKKSKYIKVPDVKCFARKPIVPPPPIKTNTQKRDVKELIEELLDELYADQRDWGNNSSTYCSHGSISVASVTSSQSNCCEQTDAIERNYLEALSKDELRRQAAHWETRLQTTGERLARSVRARDRLRRQQKRLCAAFTVLLRHIKQMSAILNSLRNLASSSRASSAGEAGARFGVAPGSEGPGEGGYAEWLHAMRLVARLPAGVPQHFRKKLWLTLAERHLTSRNVEWSLAERACFRGTAQPDDTELGAQILKDLHRTGCSLFCGAEGRENQGMLRRVLLAYARWNKEVGYCQGFNMLAAIILEVMDKSEADSLKVMIYLVEAVLPEGYFADDLRGLSADMAAFRDLLRIRLPRLANHMDHLQRVSDGGGVEPPLPDVFTMQWFLTLYATWLPRESLLRIWDLVLLDGNEVLLLTALAIWDMLQDRILSARSADEFYSCMGGGAGAVYEAGEALVARVVAFGSVPELPRLRSLHRYRVTPPVPPQAVPNYHPPLHSAKLGEALVERIIALGSAPELKRLRTQQRFRVTPPVLLKAGPEYQTPLHPEMQSMTKRGLRLFYSEDEGDSSDDGNKMALATVIPRREERVGAGDRLSLDIGALKRQYARLRERQRQAHVILAAACARHAAVGVPTSPTSLTVNNLLLGKSAIVSSRGRRLGPPPGAVPPSRQSSSPRENVEHHSRGRSTDTISWNEEKSRKSISRRNSVKWKDIKKEKCAEKIRKTSIDLDEAGDGVIVSEIEANQMIASLRSRSSSETSSYSSRTATSTDTSLCDENEKASDSEPELPDDDKDKLALPRKEKKASISPKFNDIQVVRSPLMKEERKKYSPENDSKVLEIENPVKNISDYLDSAAGEPLRTYIDGFESKLKESVIVNSESDNYKPISPFKSISPYTPHLSSDRSEILERLSSKKYEEKPSSDELIRPTNLCKPPKNLTDLSPIDLTISYKCSSSGLASPYDFDCQTNFRPPSQSSISSSRPPDIIDSFVMYPNFVPDIDLSDKNVSDLESPPRSPDAESIIVSEDEPPIPLKIDVYFEHSPEFFGARVTDPNNFDIPNRRAVKRHSRLPKKPDSLTLQTNHNEKYVKLETERASSLPQSHSFTHKKSPSLDLTSSQLKTNENDFRQEDLTKSPLLQKLETPVKSPQSNITPKDYILRSGRKNSERALQIIQENSKILSRILTKQNIAETKKVQDIETCTERNSKTQLKYNDIPENSAENKIVESPLLKESTSDSLIGYRKRNIGDETTDKNDFIRVRPISIDDPSSLELRNNITRNSEFSLKYIKSPSNESIGNRTDLYGWENKGFLAKCDYKSIFDKPENNSDISYKRKTCDFSGLNDLSSNDLRPMVTTDWARHSFSGESKASVTLPSTDHKDTSTYEKRYTSDDYNYSFSSKYNDFVLSKASDICSQTVDQGPKACEKLSKTDTSQVSDFAHVVTSSISFTYEPSAEDDSPTGVKSNSSDTLCQITSLDQVSTPISPKIFPKETSTFPKEYAEKSDKTIVESDDTCSAITSLIETDNTLSSLSYPRSPSSGSYHPFPTRPAMRMPKELGVRLGMYPKDVINSSPK